jgi:nucleoid-associated protein YgaU
MFDPPSRYFALETATLETKNGAVRYTRRRFLPHGEQMPVLTEAAVVQGDRLDLLAARTLGDPEQFWRICDANNAMDPSDLTARPGQVLRVPMPGAGS